MTDRGNALLLMRIRSFDCPGNRIPIRCEILAIHCGAAESGTVSWIGGAQFRLQKPARSTPHENVHGTGCAICVWRADDDRVAGNGGRAAEVVAGVGSWICEANFLCKFAGNYS